MDDDSYSVGRVAELAHVSVRTLHHYDEVGLLRPSARTAAGHRRYTATDLERLREVLFYRELDFGLERIAEILDEPGRDVADHLRSQHRLLRERITRQQRLLAAIEKEMEAREVGIALTPEEQFEIFGSDKFGGEYAQEAEQRWGDTDAWHQSQRRTAAYTKQDWIEIKAEDDAIRTALADAMARGLSADSGEATALAEQHRTHITRRFFDCSSELHAQISENYVSDDRFRADLDATAAGLAQYLHDAIVANSAAAG